MSKEFPDEKPFYAQHYCHVLEKGLPEKFFGTANEDFYEAGTPVENT